MAKGDYLCCSKCEAKVVYSPDDQPEGVACGACVSELLSWVEDERNDLKEQLETAPILQACFRPGGELEPDFAASLADLSHDCLRALRKEIDALLLDVLGAP